MLHQSQFLSSNGKHFRLPLHSPSRNLGICKFSMDTIDSSSSIASFSPGKLSRRASPLVLSCHASSSQASELPIRNEKSVHGVSEKTVGVLGGGQLGRMMCQAASALGVKVIVLDQMENCPASSVAHHHMVGRFDNSETVEEFAKRCDVLTVEIEHVDATTLEDLEKQGIDCQPKASTIKIIQDKFLQKVHFSKHDIPLSEFMEINDLESAEKAGDLFGYPLMIKSKRLAYDGRGNAVAKTKENLPSAVADLGGYERDLYVEKWAPFVKELSVIVARGRDGSIKCYPVVETIHEENICHIVKSPACVSWKITKLATEVASKAVSSLEGAGVFAVELFLTEDGQILLNEVAPRPHNSGHQTIEACYTSQYEQHLRAVLGLPLGDTSMRTPAAIMYNILGEAEGEEGFFLAHKLMTRALNTVGASVHWYDKPEMRKQRKMGHITILGSTMAEVESRLQSILNDEPLEVSVPPKVGIIMGSGSDLPVMKKAAETLKSFGVKFKMDIISAHRTPGEVEKYGKSAQERGLSIIIAGAGGSAHLPGMVASWTRLPVLGVPIDATQHNGMDALFSIISMPKGVPVLTLGIDDATNAAFSAIKILALNDPLLKAKLDQYKEDMANGVQAQNERLNKVGHED